jgi:hypothetical protein
VKLYHVSNISPVLYAVISPWQYEAPLYHLGGMLQSLIVLKRGVALF